MKLYDNSGNVAGEQNTVITEEGNVVSVNTMYDRGRVVSQIIGVRDQQGNVRTETIFNGKLLP